MFEFSNRNSGKQMKRKSVPLEKLIRIAFDGNRDGTIVFIKPEDQQKYIFWLNDDHDGVGSETDSVIDYWKYDTQDDLLDTVKDFDLGSHELGVIKTTRDVEDFSRVHLQVDDHAKEVIKRAASSTDYKYYLVFKNSSNPAPEIGLYKPVNEKDAYLFHVDPDKSRDAVDRADEAYKLVGREAYKIIMKDLENDVEVDQIGSDLVTPYLFEGRKEGMGDLTFVLKVGGVTIEENAATLDLHPISWFYDQFAVTYNETSKNVNPYIDTDISAKYPAKENDYVLFVHGWNMKDQEKLRWTETMFKRLWWLGYSGKVGLFSWPTLTGGTTFDDSELRSWQSSDALKRVLTYRLKDYSGKIRILAHSLGNVATGEALNKLPGPGIVKTYVASQAALSAHYYEASVDERNNWNPDKAMLLPENPLTPNLIQNYCFSGTGCKPYLSDVPGKVEKMYNYFNRRDWALTNGASDFFAWELDQNRKPDVGYTYCNRTIGCVTANTTRTQLSVVAAKALATQNEYFARVPTTGFEQELKLPEDRYEIFSTIIQSRVKAVGATKQVNSKFIGLDLGSNDVCGYDEKHYSHSKQFRSNIAEQTCYWGKLVQDMELPTVPRRDK